MFVDWHQDLSENADDEVGEALLVLFPPDHREPDAEHGVNDESEQC